MHRVAVVLVMMSVWLACAEADACTRAHLVLRVGLTGADGLAPTDVAPWLSGYLPHGATYVLRPNGGTPVPLAVREHPEGGSGVSVVELVPAAPLDPHTDYEISLTPPDEGSEGVLMGGPWLFRTGAGPLDGSAPPAPELPRITLADAFPRWSCGNGYVCVESPGERTLEATVVHPADGTVESVHFLTGRLNGWRRVDRSFESAFCLELRERDLAGRRSPPVTICSDEMDAFCFTDVGGGASCSLDGTFASLQDPIARDECTTDAGVPVDAGPDGGVRVPLIPRGGGCSVAAAGSAAPGLGLMLAALISFAATRARRRSA
jgi:hypothetical protein